MPEGMGGLSAKPKDDHDHGAATVPVFDRRAFVLTIPWQHGPEATAINGVTVEDLQQAIITRLEELQRALPCQENVNAIDHARVVLQHLQARTRRRQDQRVEGTMRPHESTR